MNEQTEKLRERIIALLNNSPLPNAGKVNYVLAFCKEAGLKFVPDKFYLDIQGLAAGMGNQIFGQVSSQIKEIELEDN